MQKKVVNLRKEVREIALDAIPEIDREGILNLIGADHPRFNEIKEVLNDSFTKLMNNSYETGYQTAVNIMYGNLNFELKL